QGQDAHGGWAVCGNEGDARRLLPDSDRQPGAGDRVGGEDADDGRGYGGDSAAGRWGLRAEAMLLSRLIETIVRTDGRRVLAGLIRLTGDFDAAEDALQEAYARALTDWPRSGVPDKPGAWLNTVARRVAIDRLRRARGTDLPDDLAAPATEHDFDITFD